MISSATQSKVERFFARRARLRRIASHFEVPWHISAYIVGKLATDPAYAAVLQQVRNSSLPILDIGCGLGLLAHYLRDYGCEAPIVGCDIDRAKIAKATAAAQRARLANVTFACAEATETVPGSAIVVLLDVIHYLNAAEQRAFLERLAARGDVVLIRNAVDDQSWRYRLTIAEEYWTRLTGWIPSKSPIRFPTCESVIAPFREAGHTCEMRPLWGRTPFSSRLFVFAPAKTRETCPA
jgi:2-polyprenyl-3-methyl-5-hydroxy-6-metoxy-1,4-benzoquinol methylase